MNKYLSCAALIGLTACISPQERCISQAMGQTSLLRSQIAEIEGNIARGYAIERVPEVTTEIRECEGVTDSGERFTYECPEVVTTERTQPRAINVAEQRALLSDLQSRYAQEQRAQAARIEQCRTAYPES